MAENSKIEWCHHTFNPWIGCTKVSAGCDNCYAEAMMDSRLGKARWGHGNPRTRTSPANWRKPIQWDSKAKAAGERHRVFCASLSDVFDSEVSATWRDDLMALITNTPNLDWLLLTKRPSIARSSWKYGRPLWPKNIWIGATVESDDVREPRLGQLRQIQGHIRFLSCEPLIAPIDLLGTSESHTRLTAEAVDWVICGGESGPNARDMNPDWARSLRDQCAALGIPFFMKQMARKAPIPDDLMIREYPEP